MQGEIISVDSVAVYSGPDIGSAKPDAATRAQVPHHLIDLRTPDCPYTVADFVKDARAAIQDIQGRGRTPILAGGTMMYFRALERGLHRTPASDPKLRAAIMAEGARHGWPRLHAELARLDPQAAQRIHPGHSSRIARALELCRATGRRAADWPRDAPLESAHRVARLGLSPPRELLLQRIRARFDEMLRRGLVDETRTLMREWPDAAVLRSVGYRQVVEHLQGRLSVDSMREAACIATARLAKRQRTWMRSWPGLVQLLHTTDDKLLQCALSALRQRRELEESV